MAKIFSLKTTISLFFLALLCLGYANSARVLDEEVSPQNPLPTTTGTVPEASDPREPVDPSIVAPVVAPAATLPSGQIPAATVPSHDDNTAAPVADDPTGPVDPSIVAPVVAPAATLPSGQIPAATVPSPDDNTAAPVADDPTGPAAPVIAPSATDTSVADEPTVTAPVGTPATATTGGAAAAAAAAGANTGTTVGNANPDHPILSFFMHDILGGSHPSGRVVTGIVANTDANGLPFSKPNNPIFPLNGGVPLNTINGVINNNNFPLLAGLNGSPANTILSNNGGNSVQADDNQPFVTAGQLPAGLTLQQLMFGSITVVDNEITEGHELGTSVLGRAQGFYLASSLDGSSHTLALTAMFHGGEHEIEDSISFFGVHRTATPISHLAIIGGAGKYENAKGYATIETDLHHEDQHTTDGVETITHFTVYLTP